jgi:methionine biosynthesis protein MetW
VLSNVEGLYRAIWDRKLAGPSNLPPPGTRVAVGVDLARELPGVAVLDVGCGDGTFLSLVAASFAVLHGVELARNAAGQAASRGAVAVVADLDRAGLPYCDRSFDLVSCLDVIEHVLDPQHLVSEIARVLRPGGHSILATPNIRYWRHLRQLIIAGRFPRTSGDVEGYDGGHLHYFTYADVEELLLAAGLQPMERSATYGGRGRSLPRAIKTFPLLQELLATGAFVVARRPEG